MRAAIVLAALLYAPAALAQEDFSQWPVIDGPFPSTGGGGVMIEGYAPKVVGKTCVTPFVARLPDGQRFSNSVEFDAAEMAGGTLCSNGRWRSADGSASGTTPLRVFIRDGIARRSP
ncbi:MAG: hypothetical protein ACRCUX_01315 [Beijerinckiaceae bacterium]